MKFDLILFFLLIISGIEIFTSIFTRPLLKFDKKGQKRETKVYTVVKLIFIVLFIGITIYFLYRAVYTLGILLDIPVDKSLLDIIRGLTK
ncbi:hypothetical protein [Senegalia massiliensis]|uniref:Uncharacterized protein n=1 Tax=Senegalia massiliensis TaxID=1720316 RepID=A0A845QZA6_9CLOT|nr:hypothetical protein [Senegalia massiliensis]NBI07815.1 hypothetical protein [Senegalia massiliensis]